MSNVTMLKKQFMTINKKVIYLDGKTEEEQQRIINEQDLEKIKKIVENEKFITKKSIQDRLSKECIPVKFVDYFKLNPATKTYQFGDSL